MAEGDAVMGWMGALSLLCLAVIALCAYLVWRDHSLRGMRISNAEIQRERVTISIPFIDHDYKDRT